MFGALWAYVGGDVGETDDEVMAVNRWWWTLAEAVDGLWYRRVDGES